MPDDERHKSAPTKRTKSGYDFLRKRERPDEEKTYCPTEANRGSTPGTQPETHFAAPGMLQMAEEKPA
jgi:hypothetical protein